MSARSRLDSYFPTPYVGQSLLDSVFGPAQQAHSSARETDTSYIVEVEMPGIPPEDIEVSIADSVLTIKGERRREVSKDGPDGKPQLVSHSYGQTMKQYVLPKTVDTAKVAATAENGILTITLEKTAPQRIPITVKRKE